MTKGSIETLNINVQNSMHDLIARACHAIYDVSRDSNRFRYEYLQHSDPSIFDRLRKLYVERDEYNTCSVKQSGLRSLGFQVF